MKTILKFSVLSVLLLLFMMQNGFAQDGKASWYRHELTAGLGYVYGFEKNVFNLPEDNPVKSVLGVNLNYCYYFNEHIGAGVRILGNTKGLPDYYVVNSGGTMQKKDFTLYSSYFDGELRYVFSRGTIEPYGFIMMGLSSGIIFDGDEHMSYSGYNFGAGAGAKFRISERWRVSAELSGVLGDADWEPKPFVNSTSSEFDPSSLGLMVNISYLFGPQKIIKGSK